MKIKTSYQSYSRLWQAIDEDSYDGPPCPVGVGEFEEEAVKDLLEQVNLPYLRHNDKKE